MLVSSQVSVVLGAVHGDRHERALDLSELGLGLHVLKSASHVG
ncbi:hypothetical protein ACFV8Z_40280 [Streptomyces sp. NPDC059837]